MKTQSMSLIASIVLVITIAFTIIAITAITTQYYGVIELKLGNDGGYMKISGSKSGFKEELINSGN